MNTIKRINNIVIFILLFFQFSSAQTEDKKLDFSGQIRLRGEDSDKNFNNKSNEVNYTLLRTRLNFNYKISDKIAAFIQLQDSRIFGEEGQDGSAGTTTSIRNVDLHQAFIQIDKFIVPWLAYKFGRMTLSYGDQRLLGMNEFSNVGRSFDANNVSIILPNFRIDIFHSTLHESLQSPDTTDGDQILTGLWMKYNRAKSTNINLYALYDQNMQQNILGDSNFERLTLGSRVGSTLGYFDLNAELNFQTGKYNFNQDISAFYFSGAFAYNFNMSKKPQLLVGLDYLSGDKSETERYECFSTLYPAKHRFFGYMDYFTDIPKHTRNLGLTDLMTKLKLRPFQTVRLESDFHIFKLAEKATLDDGSLSNDLGTEIDLTLIYEYMKNVNFTLGCSGFQAGKVFKEWKGEEPSWWLYVQTTVNF